VQVHAAFEGVQRSTLALRSSSSAHPNIWRLIALSRLIFPSIGPLLQGVVMDSSTASIQLFSFLALPFEHGPNRRLSRRNS